MDALGSMTAVSGIISIVYVNVIPAIALYHRVITLARYYGYGAAIVINVLVRNLWCNAADLLHACDDAMANAFRQTQQSESNTTAIVASIVASIATTALQLDRLPDVHWSARAFIVASLILSLGSVVCTTKLQKSIGALSRAEHLRRFIGVRKHLVLPQARTLPNWRTTDPFMMDVPRAASQGRSRPWPGEGAEDEFHVYLPSVAACLELSRPRLFMWSSVVAFITGLGIYLGFLMTPAVEGANAQGVFVTYCIVTFCSFAFYWQVNAVQSSRGVGDRGDKVMADLAEKRRAAVKRLKSAGEAELKILLRQCCDDDEVRRLQRQLEKEPDVEEHAPPSQGFQSVAPAAAPALGMKAGIGVKTTEEANQEQPASPSANLARLAEAHAQLMQEQLRLAQAYQELARQYTEVLHRQA